jgi:hypothetical protein
MQTGVTLGSGGLGKREMHQYKDSTLVTQLDVQVQY